MTQVHALKLDAGIDAELYKFLLCQVSIEKRKKICSFLNRQDALRTLFADLMARYVVTGTLGIKNEDIAFRNSPYGKPYLVGVNDYHFNTSHSGDWVVCVADSVPIGIDVERMKEIDLQMAQSCFSEKEIEKLNALESTEQLDFFYDLWTLKESYIKLIGQGLSMPLDAFSILDDKDGVPTLHTPQASFKTYFGKYELDESYKMSICALSSPLPELTMISVEQLVDFFKHQLIVNAA